MSCRRPVYLNPNLLFKASQKTSFINKIIHNICPTILFQNCLVSLMKKLLLQTCDSKAPPPWPFVCEGVGGFFFCLINLFDKYFLLKTLAMFISTILSFVMKMPQIIFEERYIRYIVALCYLVLSYFITVYIMVLACAILSYLL